MYEDVVSYFLLVLKFRYYDKKNINEIRQVILHYSYFDRWNTGDGMEVSRL